MNTLRIGIVGPCAAGKTTLAAGLARHGYLAKPIAQEHSFVPAMWQRITNPDLLIYLEVSFQATLARRRLNWTPPEYEEQLRRLAHARQHADLRIDTNELDVEGVLNRALEYLEGLEQPG
jgi:deoxyadenosine/deoxycytidine kinase